MNPTNLYSYYQSKGKQLPSTVAGRFADPEFASASQRAGYDANSYQINMGNADANQKILAELLKGSQTPTTQPNTPTTTTTPTTSISQLNNTQPLGSLVNGSQDTGNQNTPSPFDYSSLKGRTTYQDTQYTPPDLNQIKTDTLNRYQTQIDAIKQLYATEINKARQAGLNQLGQAGAIQARSGLSGSNIGSSQDAQINQNTQDNVATLNAKEASAINDIINNVQNSSVNEYTAKSDAIDKILSANAKSREDKQKAVETNTAGLAQDLFNRGIDPSTLSLSDWNAITKAFKDTNNTEIDPNAVYSAYKDYKLAQDKATNSADKERYITIGDGTQLYDKQTGKIIASNEKDKNVDPISGLSPAQATLFSGIVNKYQQSPLIKASDRTPVLQSAINSVKADPSNSAIQLNLVYSYVQALDTYQSAVREGELGLVNSIDSKAGQLKNYVTQITNGQIVRPEVAKQIADASQALVDTISKASRDKSSQFKAEADTLGLGDAWNKYTGGFTSPYNPSTQGTSSSTISNTGGLQVNWD